MARENPREFVAHRLLAESAMETKLVVKKLISLIHLDIDAVHAYTRALVHVGSPTVRRHLEEFRGDHERHVAELSHTVRDLGGDPPPERPDVKGVVLEVLTAMRSITGTEGALKAMKANERLTKATYEAALQLELPEDVAELVRKNFEDEKRHLEWVEGAIERQVWQGEEAAQPGAGS
jgi:rubrerythrin